MRRLFLRMMDRVIAAMVVLTVTMSLCAPVARADEEESDDLSETIAAMQQQEEETQQAISDLEKRTKETKAAIQALQGQREQTQSSVNSLERKSSSLQSEISDYTDQLEDIGEEISATEDALAEVSSQIVQLNNELQAAHGEEQARYEALKKRLQAVYESGGTQGMLQILLETGSMKEFLTTASYMEAVVRYDMKKISEYQELQADIEARTAVVEEKESELDQYQSELDEKQEMITDLSDAVQGELNTTRSSINSERGKLASYNEQLTELDSKMKKLEAATAAAQAKLAQQIDERLKLQREDTSGAYSASGDELEWLAATIQAEADGESYTGKLAVGSVIMNRVKSSAFPNSIVGVITQNMQFASYRSGKVELIISRGPNSTCLRAAQEVLGGARVGDYLFFMTKYYADYYRISEYTMIGNHAFFYRWVTKDSAPAAQQQPKEESSAPAEEAQPEDDGSAEEGNGEGGGEEPSEESGSEEESGNEEGDGESSEENSE
ncbi:MAG: cell wall hydrolase [Lachnospiraceae bacterium]|nr:cell wall hydrolase [Lachnospiraceae bacterium]